MSPMIVRLDSYFELVFGSGLWFFVNLWWSIWLQELRVVLLECAGHHPLYFPHQLFSSSSQACRIHCTRKGK